VLMLASRCAAESARAQPATRFGPGMAGGTPHGLGYPPSAYKTGAKNISDSKIPRAIRRTIFWTIFYFLVRRRVSRLNERPDPPAVDPAGRGIDQAAVEAARMIRSHDIANSQVAGQRVWQLADYARFEADWVRAISAGDIAAIRKAVEDTSLPWHEQLADVRATIDTMLGRQAKASLPPPDGLRTPAEAARKPRRPTLASVAKQANRAAIAVVRYEIKPDGTIVVVTGQGEQQQGNELDEWIAKHAPAPERH